MCSVIWQQQPTWNPDLPCLMTSDGPPWLVANVGRPHVMASTTVCMMKQVQSRCMQQQVCASQYATVVCNVVHAKLLYTGMPNICTDI